MFVCTLPVSCVVCGAQVKQLKAAAGQSGPESRTDAMAKGVINKISKERNQVGLHGSALAWIPDGMHAVLVGNHKRA